MAQNLDFYETQAHFIDGGGDGYDLQVGDQRIRGKRVVACGARPFIPPIEGLEAIEYLTNESVLDLQQRPESLVTVGGGYISAEYALFRRHGHACDDLAAKRLPGAPGGTRDM